MATKSIFKRGFKANAERLSEQYRKELKIHAWAPMCAFKLAEHFGVSVHNARDFVTDPSEIKILSGDNGHDCEWSALTMTTKIGNSIIIHNSFQSIARQQSNLMHELAHIILKHKCTGEYSSNIPFGLREYNAEQEEEAKYLGASLQLTKACLFWARKRQMTTENIAKHFNASPDMIIYRMNITGIAKIHC